jgi:palmitoyltransferase
MDHHCPWTGNCIGLKTHKYFFCFLFWTVIACSHVGLSSNLMYPLHNKNAWRLKKDREFALLSASMAPVLAIAVAIGVGILFIAHFHFLAYNESSIESAELKLGENPYDLEKMTDNLK